MDVRRVAPSVTVALLTFLVAGTVRAQTVPSSPVPAATPTPMMMRPPGTTEADRAMLRPLVEIGRVRATTPYCGALARARIGTEAAVAYEYQAPQVAADLRSFRFDSGLHHAAALKQTERDLSLLWDLTLIGRADVVALRKAAQAPDVDEQQRKEMIAFADALDGAKQRQQLLAKDIARVVAVYAEQPIRTQINDANDDNHGNDALKTGLIKSGPVPTPAPQFITDTMNTTYENDQRKGMIFGAFAAEDFIKQDLKVASDHATAAMKLGHCSGPVPPSAP
ncbi:MAG TPA: hypothetical protein VHT53_01150 [Candidatus Elarobacter sp.]|jgi:hypothetical protein|nr:hypothetical protein [Candidatus Elarobacter sp.]